VGAIGPGSASVKLVGWCDCVQMANLPNSRFCNIYDIAIAAIAYAVSNSIEAEGR